MRARRAAATSGSEETAGRSRLTSNRRFASGRRPGWLRPREVSPSRILANRSNRRRSRPLAGRPPTGANSCSFMTIATSSNRRLTSSPRSTSTASDRCRTPGHEKAARRPDSERLRADIRKTPLQGGEGARPGSRFGPGLPREAEETRSRAAHPSGDGCGSAIDRAILWRACWRPEGRP